MPSKNSRKIYAEENYYHVYNRGVEKRTIFIDEEDYATFLNLFKRHLSTEVVKDKYGRAYQNYFGKVELLAFCLMPNHYHLLFYLNKDKLVIKELMQRISTAYVGYFNKKYNRVGHLFQDRFKASIILRDDYLHHISRYIHLNPSEYENYEWSSIQYYLKRKQASWILEDRILEIFDGSPDSYQQFLNDHKEHISLIEELEKELADY